MSTDKINLSNMGIVKPEERLKRLAEFGNMVEVDSNIPIKRYYRSGMEMVKMANVYLSENNFENAYILFIKFMVLFLEKIQTHPEYKTIPVTLKQPNQSKLKEIFPITEKLKDRLKDRYQKEYTQFLARKIDEEKEVNNQNQMTSNDINNQSNSDIGVSTLIPMNVKSTLLDNVIYPNDFPPDLKSSSNSGLILPVKSTCSLKPSISLIEGGLRSVVIPSMLMGRFLSLAKSNTDRNIETCGILAGKLASNQFSISHLILPKQHGTADSCVTMHEEELFDYQDQYNLITLGWIHTHPTQTAFLSSVDLHTHCSYQMMMSEAIAIVCAPKYQTTGFYCLTPEYGLDFISRCRKTGFHPHPNEPPLFIQASHIQLDDNVKLDIVDLRGGLNI